MSSRYNFENDITFAEKQFAEATKRGVKRGKKLYRTKLMRKFGEDILTGIGQDIFTGINKRINDSADILHAQALPQKANYEVWNSRGAEIRKYEEDRIKNKMTEEEYLKQLYASQMKAQLESKYGPDINYNILNPFIDSEAGKLAAEGVDEYKAALAAALELPVFSQEVDANGNTAFDNFYRKHGSAPRTLGGRIVKKVTDVFKRENDETIEFKNQKAKDFLYGTAFYEKYGDFGAKIEAYDLATGRGNVLERIVRQAQLKGLWKNKLDLANAKVDQDITIQDGKIITEDFMIIPQLNATTGSLEVPPENRIKISREEVVDENSLVNVTHLNNLTDDLRGKFILNGEEINPQKQVLEALGTFPPTADKYKDALLLIAENPIWVKPDFAEADKRENAFQKYKSRMLQFATNDEGQLIAVESPPRSGIFIVRKDRMEDAEKLKLTDKHLVAKFEQFAGDVMAAHNQSSSSTSLDDLNQEEITKYLGDDKTKIDYFSSMVNDNDMVREVITKKIEDALTKNSNIERIDLGEIDFNDFDDASPFENPLRLFFDVKNQQYYIKIKA